MGGYVLRRIAQAVFILFLISLTLFGLINSAPGDPVTAMISSDPYVRQYSNPEDIERQRKALGLDQPWPVRYVIWLDHVFHGDLGISFISNRPVAEIIVSHIAPTVLLMGTATILAILIGVPLGIVSALKERSLLDHFLGAVAFLGISFPSFYLAILALFVFALKIPLFPTFGMQTLLGERSMTPVLDVVWHMVLPVSVLTFERIAYYMRYVRASMVEVMFADYVRTARAKGLVERLVVLRHMFPNALLSVVTLIGLSIPGLFSGAVLIETIFSWPGLGFLAVDATGRRDYPLIMGFNLMIAVIVLIANLLTDVVYAYVDPRIRIK